MTESIKVSVICATYNHEKYIKYALDSVIRQKTNFQFEVLIGEDCSTDNSKKILEEYEKKYPNIFTIFYRKSNYGAVNNFKDLYERARGEYIIVLETDDFWLDNNKLQIQADFLDNNPVYLAVAHRCLIVDENNECLGIEYPECKKRKYSLKDFRHEILPGQTTTIMYRNYYRKDLIDTKLCNNEEYELGPGDMRKAFMICSQGKIACLDQYMSAYRYITSGGSSYSANVGDANVEKIFWEKYIMYKYAVKELKDFKAIYSSGYILFSVIFRAKLKRKNFQHEDEINKKIKMLKWKNIYLGECIFQMFLSILKRPFGKNLLYKKVSVSSRKKIMEGTDYWKII